MISVYVAGPIGRTDATPDNCKLAIREGRKLLEAGFAPFVPHLWYAGLRFTEEPSVVGSQPSARSDSGSEPKADGRRLMAETDWSAWLDYDRLFVMRSDILLRLPGVSPGADLEERWARLAGRVVVRGLAEDVIVLYGTRK